MPALPSSVLEPLWIQVAALLPTRQVHHPLGCHRPRVPPAGVRQAHPGAGVRLRLPPHRRSHLLGHDPAPPPRRVDRLWAWPSSCAWLVLGAYDQLFGLELEQLAVDSCTTKAPCGGQVAGPSPVDRRKQGLKRSVAAEAGGIPRPPCPPRPTSATTGCWLRPWTPSALLGPLPASGPWCTWTPATTTSRVGRCWPPSGHGGPDRHPWGASTDPGCRRWVIERTHAWEPVRQVALVHRAAQGRGRVLAGAG